MIKIVFLSISIWSLIGALGCAASGVNDLNANAVSKNDSWALVFMDGLETEYDRKLPDGYVRHGNDEELADITLTTFYDTKQNQLIGTFFEGCNGLINLGKDSFKNNWVRTGTQVGCATMLRRIEPSESGNYEFQETAFSLRQFSEDRFLKLSQMIDQPEVDWTAGKLEYLDQKGRVLMSFRLKEAAE